MTKHVRWEENPDEIVLEDANCTLLPLFSSPVGIFSVSENLSSLLSIKTDYKFNPIFSERCYNLFQTENLNVLDNFQKEKKILTDYFLIYANKILKLDTNNFRMTTSWGTKTEPNGFSNFHSHRNSIFSGIFYFDDIESGNFELDYSKSAPQIMMNPPSKWNLYNSESWEIPAEKNRLIFFPSNISHRIKPNESSKTRYSLAFNYFLEGSFGYADSALNITINRII